MYFPDVELSFKANQLRVRIDSIKNELHSFRDKKSESFSYKNIKKIKALKIGILDFNSFVKKYYSDKARIKTADFINVVDVSKGTSSIPWETYYFEKTNVYSTITILTFIDGQILKLQQKAIQTD